jgi:hypothetical protein
MDFCIRNRQGGKTRESILWLARDPSRVLLTISESEATRLRREYRSLSGQVLSAGNPIDLQGRRVSELGIDNLDMLLEMWLPVRGIAPVTWVTATGNSC